MNMHDPSTLIIFGATGNLSELKLLPALYHLDEAGLLNQASKIVCCGRQSFTDDKWIEYVADVVTRHARNKYNDKVFERFSARLSYFQGDVTDAATLTALKHLLSESQLPENHIFYLSMPPATYGDLIANLGHCNMLTEQSAWRRVVIEKPFGSDLESARVLQNRISAYLQEHQIYRIDHYMGKAMVQNVLVARFANLITEPLWNRNYIDHVQITRIEQHGIGGRGAFYEKTGALRDMLQSHLMQMMALVAMEPPVSMDAEDLRDEKVKVLKSVRPLNMDSIDHQAFRAQYTEGNIDKQLVKGYLQESAVASNSKTETYAALKLYVDNWRWRDVPFYLRTGKRMGKACTMVAIKFKQPPKHFFRSVKVQQPAANWLIMSMSPQESMRLEISIREPGLSMDTRQISLDAPFRCEHHQQTDAYEGLLLDVMEGDSSLFLRFDEVDYAWQIVDPVLNVWQSRDEPLATYSAGKMEPAGVSGIFEQPEHKWRNELEPADPHASCSSG